MNPLIAALCLLAVLGADSTIAQTKKSRPVFVEYPRGVLGSKPSRRDGPLREENIRDEEVREIQSATRNILPGTIVNIGGVVTGCPCEDGPQCQDQVWIVAYKPERTRGLMVSRIDDRWGLGPLQQWWLDYEKAPACWRIKDESRKVKCLEAEQALVDRFPQCEDPTVSSLTRN